MNRDFLEEAKKDPRASQLLSKLSDEDRAKLSDALSSPEKIKRLLATDKAKEMLRRIQGK